MTAARRTPSAGLRARLFVLAVVPSWAALLLTAGAVATLGPPPVREQLLVLAVGTVLVGLPHGAVDHLAVPRARGIPATRRPIAAVGLLYLLLGGAYAVGWFLAPAAAAVGFVALTWLHWGQGDVSAMVGLLPGEHPDDLTGRVLAAAVRGGVPMVVPLLAFPAWYRRVLGWFVAPFGGAGAGLDLLGAPGTRVALGAALASLTVLAVVRGYCRVGATTAWRVDAAEMSLLWAFFLVVPPLLAVGVYFALWHSLRHVARLLSLDRRTRAALSAGRVLAALGRFARDATPLTLAALALLGGLWLVVPVTPTRPGEATGLSLAFVAVLTLPHVAVVAALDREQRLWAG